MIKFVIIYYLVINLITFILFGIDKMKAKKGAYRIPEKTLLGFSLLGGAFLGFLGMHLFHHKTKKPAFYISVPVFMLLHILFWIYWIYGIKVI